MHVPDLKYADDSRHAAVRLQFLHSVYNPPPNLYPVFTPLSLLLHCTPVP